MLPVNLSSWKRRPTGGEALIGAVGRPSCDAERLHGNGVVRSAGDASHEAMGVLGVAAGVAVQRRQGRDERLRRLGVRPRHVGHGLSHLIHSQVHRAAGVCRRSNKYIQLFRKKNMFLQFFKFFMELIA